MALLCLNNPLLQSGQRLILEPLAELSRARHADVRARQLECAARLLHSRGDQLGAAWPLMLNVIAAIADHHRYTHQILLITIM